MEIRDCTGEGGAGGSQLRYQTTVSSFTHTLKTHLGLGPVSAHHTACLWQD